MIRRKLGKIKRRLLEYVNTYRYPYRLITSMPSERPSVDSVYYLINQLGAHRPVGLTHEIGTGYHELPFPSLHVKTSRSDLQNRLNRLDSFLEIKGAYGIDIGCALGGLTFGLQQMGAHMVGIDRDVPSIAVANECEDLFGTGASFVCDNFKEEIFPELVKAYANPKTTTFDFAIWFSSFNWVAEALGAEKIKSLLQALSNNAEQLIADSAIGGKGAIALSTLGIVSNETFVEFILKNSQYTKFELIGEDEDWYNRKVYRFFR